MRSTHREPNMKNDKQDISVPFWKSSRLGVTILLFFGFFYIFSIRVNINMSIVCMVNHTAIGMEDANITNQSNLSKCHRQDDHDKEYQRKDGPFMWDRNVQANILGAYFWPYAILQIPGSILVTKYGAHKVFACVLSLTSVITLVTPIVSRVNYVGTIVLRGLLGALTSVTFVSCQYILGRWIPIQERSRLSALTYAGIESGILVTYAMTGFLCEHGFDGGWPSTFYLQGIAGMILACLWIVFIRDTPEDSKRISDVEKKYICASLQRKNESTELSKKKNIPWKRILTSVPVYAIIVVLFASDWAFLFMGTFVPTYLDDVFQFNTGNNGLISALPSIPLLVVTLLNGALSDFIQNRCLTRGQTRKLFTILSMIVPALIMVGLGHVECSSPELAIVLLLLCNSMRGFRYAGFIENALDIDPHYASIIFGLANIGGAIGGYLSSVVVGSVTVYSTREEWQICFYIAAAVEISGALFYVVFASSNVNLSKMSGRNTIEPVVCNETDKDVQIQERNKEINVETK